MLYVFDVCVRVCVMGWWDLPVVISWLMVAPSVNFYCPPTKKPCISNKGSHSSKTSRQRLLGSKIKAVWHSQTACASDQPVITVCEILCMQQSSCFPQSREDQKGLFVTLCVAMWLSSVRCRQNIPQSSHISAGAVTSKSSRLAPMRVQQSFLRKLRVLRKLSSQMVRYPVLGSTFPLLFLLAGQKCQT